MPTILYYKRYFDKNIVYAYDQVKVITEVYFTSPPSPTTTCWFTNIGDNLGGADPITGPFTYVSSTVTLTNLFPNTVQKAWLGHGTSNGCMRLWAVGPAYPTPVPVLLSNVWKPINPSTFTCLRVEAVYTIKGAAQSGTVITMPLDIIPPSTTNFTPGLIMGSAGPELVLTIDGSPIPAGYYRNLVIY